MSGRMQLKEQNRHSIYQLIYDSEGVSKQQIAHSLGLSLPTVSQNLSELKEKGLIVENGTFESTGGRKARIIRGVDDVKVALGLDFTRNHISMVLVDMKGRVMNSIRLRLQYRDKQEYYDAVEDNMDRFVKECGVDTDKILGTGVSLPAIIAEDGRQITYLKVLPAPDDLYGRLRSVIRYPYTFFNDANAGCYAEFWRRQAERPLVYVSLSNSVGGAIMYTEQVYCGENQRGGEFGHIVLEPGGRECYCGQRGCADAYCNAKLLSAASDGSLRSFFDQVREGDPRCCSVFRKYLEYLSRLVVDLRMSFDCDVVLGGYVGSYMGEHMDRLMELVNARNPFEKNGAYVKVCDYRFEASAVGAALHYIDEYIQGV